MAGLAPIKLYGGLIPDISGGIGEVTIIYSVPSNKKVIIKHLVVFNASGSDKQFFLSVSNGETSYNILVANVKTFDYLILDLNIVLNENEVLSMSKDGPELMYATISGVEVSL